MDIIRWKPLHYRFEKSLTILGCWSMMWEVCVDKFGKISMKEDQNLATLHTMNVLPGLLHQSQERDSP